MACQSRAPDVDFHSSGSLSDRDSVYRSNMFVLGCSFKLSALRWRKLEDSKQQHSILKHKLELTIVVHK